MISTGQIRIAEAQNKPKPVHPQEQKPALQHAPLPAQQVAPQAAYRRAQVDSSGLRPADLLVIQRTVGNRQVQRMMARRVDSANVQQQHALAEEKPGIKVQTKLTAGAPDDVYEQEADRVAGQVMTMPDAATQRPINVSYRLPRSVSDQAVARLVQRFPVYRGGPHEAVNYVPRIPQDMSGPKRGLSTFEKIADIPPKYRPAQQIETDSLAAADLEAIRNGGGKNSHVSIVPTNDLPPPAPAASTKKSKPKATYPKLTEWATVGATHGYTIAVMNARTGEVK